MLNVFGLLPVALGLLERLDDERGGRGNHRDFGLTVLNGEFDGHSEALPVLGCFLGDVFSDLLGRETERTDLRSERTRCSDLATGDSDEDVDDLGWVKLRRHCVAVIEEEEGVLGFASENEAKQREEKLRMSYI